MKRSQERTPTHLDTLSFSDSSDMVGIPGVIPFTWEEQPGRPKPRPSSAIQSMIHDPFRGSIRHGSMRAAGSISRAGPGGSTTVGFETSSSDEDSGLEARVMRLNLKASLMGVHILDDETEMFFSRQVSNASINSVSSYGISSRHTVGAVPFKWEVEPGKPLQEPSSSSTHETSLGALLPPPPGSRATSGSLYSGQLRISGSGLGPDQPTSHMTHQSHSGPRLSEKLLKKLNGHLTSSGANGTTTTTTTMHLNGLKILRKPRGSSSETLDRHFGHYDYDLTYGDASTAHSPTSTLDHAETSISSPDLFPDERELCADATAHLQQFKKLGVGPGASSQLAQCLLSLTEMADDTTDEDDIILDGNATRDWRTSLHLPPPESEFRTHHQRDPELARSGEELRAGSLEGPEFVGLPDEVCSLEWPIVPYRRRRRRIRNNNFDDGKEESAAGSSATTTQQERWSSNSSSWNLSLVAQKPKLTTTNVVVPVSPSHTTARIQHSASIGRTSASSRNPQSLEQQQQQQAGMGRLETGTSVVKEVRRHSARSSSSSTGTGPVSMHHDGSDQDLHCRNKWERDSAMSSSSPSADQLVFEAYDRPEEVVHTVDEEDFPFSPIASSFVFEENNNSVEFSPREGERGGGGGGRGTSEGMIPRAVGPMVQEFTTNTPQFENLREFYEDSESSDNSSDNSLTYSLKTGAFESEQQRRRRQVEWIPTKSFHYIRGNGVDIVHELSFSTSSAALSGYLELNRSGRFSIDLQRSPRLERHRSSSRLQQQQQQQQHNQRSTPQVLIRIMKDATNLNNPHKKKTKKQEQQQQPSPSKTSSSQCKCLPVPRKGFLGRCLSSNQRPRLAVANSFDARLMRTVNEHAPTGAFQFF